VAKGVEVEIFGVPEVTRFLKQLEPKIRRKCIRQAIRAGLKVIQAGVKERMPRDTGTAIRATIVRVWKSKRRGTIAMEVRFDTDEVLANSPPYKGDPRGHFFYIATIEWGSEKIDREPVAPCRRTYDEDGPRAEAVARQVLISGVQAEIGG
jgi:Bacteriophage HK97-gp10, putative tail-component